MIDIEKSLEEFEAEIDALDSKEVSRSIFKKSLQIFESLKTENEKLKQNFNLVNNENSKINSNYKKLSSSMIQLVITPTILFVLLFAVNFFYFHNKVDDNKVDDNKQDIKVIKAGTLISKIDEMISKNRNLLNDSINSESAIALKDFNQVLIEIRQQSIESDQREGLLDQLQFYIILICFTILILVFFNKLISSIKNIE